MLRPAVVGEPGPFASPRRVHDGRDAEGASVVETNVWAADVLRAQQRRVGESIATLERLRGAMVSAGAGIQWRSRAAEQFSRRVEVQVASIDGLVLALRELDGAMRRAGTRVFHVEHGSGSGSGSGSG